MKEDLPEGMDAERTPIPIVYGRPRRGRCFTYRKIIKKNATEKQLGKAFRSLQSDAGRDLIACLCENYPKYLKILVELGVDEVDEENTAARMRVFIYPTGEDKDVVCNAPPSVGDMILQSLGEAILK